MNSKTLATPVRSHLLLLGLILILAALLRCFSLGALGFWTDEFCTLSCSHGWGLQFDQVPVDCLSPTWPAMTRLSGARPIGEIIPALARDEAHPPLYFLMVRFWEALWGDSEPAVRSLNVVFSICAVALLFFAARESIGSTAALWACLVMAVTQPQIEFSQEARNYMAVVTFSLLAVLAIQRLKRRPALPAAIVLTISLAVMMLTHYFAAGVAAALGLYSLFFLRGRSWVVAISAFGGSAALFLVLWGPLLFRQLPHFRNNYAWVSDTGPDRFVHLSHNLCRVPWRLIGEMPQPPALRLAVETLGAACFLILPILFVRRSELRLWVVWFTLSIGLIACVDLFRFTAQLALLRYSLFATPAMCVLIAGCIRRGAMRFAPAAAAVLLGFLSLPPAYVPAWKIDFRTPVQLIGRRLEPQDGLVILGPDRITDGIMFAAFQHYLPKMPESYAVLTRSPSPAILDRLQACPHVWIVRTWPGVFRGLPGYVVEDHQSVPYFADLVLGRFIQPGHK